MQSALDFFRREKGCEIFVMDEQGTYFNNYLASKIDIQLFTARTAEFAEVLNEADFIFCSFIQEINMVFELLRSSKPQVVNIWHGFPIRAIGFNSIEERKMLEEVRSHPVAELVTIHHILLSEFYEKTFQSSFSGLKNIFWNFGNIRASSILDENVHARFMIKNLFHNRDIEHVIMYTPTHSLDKDKLIPIWPDYDGARLNQFLLDNKIIMLIKQHDGGGVQFETGSNIIELDTSKLLEVGIYSQNLFRYIDLLMADVSSVVIDYFLLDKPVIFNQVPLEYLNRVGGYMSTDFFQAGHVVTTQEEAESAIINALKLDPFKESRKSVISEVYRVSDGDTLNKILDLISSPIFAQTDSNT